VAGLDHGAHREARLVQVGIATISVAHCGKLVAVARQLFRGIFGMFGICEFRGFGFGGAAEKTTAGFRG
jgi:hypothetical protein